MYAPYELARVQTQVPYARKSRYLLGIEQRRSDYLRFRHCSSTTTAPVTPQIPIEANVGDLTSPEKALAFSVSARTLTVSSQYTDAFIAFERELSLAFRCVLCGELFNGGYTGTLSCSFHPYAYVNTATNSSGYDFARDPPTKCVQCAELHLMPTVRNDDLVRLNLRHGCTAIDHCVDVHELLERPYIAVPAIFWTLLAISKRRSTQDFVRLATNADKRNGIIVVHSPLQLRMVLVVDIPGTAKAFRLSVAEVYERMAARFNIERLANEVYSARIQTAESSISRMTQFAHPQAARRDALRRLQRRKAHFAPFVIVARVQQCEGGGMRLEEYL